MITTVADRCLDLEGPLSEAAAEAWLPRTCFKHGPPGQIGVELELQVISLNNRVGWSCEPIPGPAAGLHRRLLELPLTGAAAGRVTIEPGGQVELSSAPAPDVATLCGATTRDLAAIKLAAAAHAVRLAGVGLRPDGDPGRILHGQRYAAMEAYFDRWGPDGRHMMRSTASVQVNVEAGRVDRPADDLVRRWHLLHDVAPVMIAAFANSPLRQGRPTGWKSSRQQTWANLDPARTGAPSLIPGEDPRPAWSTWVLDAPLMLVQRPHGAWTAPPRLTFREWINAGRRAIPDRAAPTLSDLAYHLTTLFPPVRARGHLEVRYLDALPGGWWRAPAIVFDTLLEDDAATDATFQACAAVRSRSLDAARIGLADPQLAEAARSVFEIAIGTLNSGSGVKRQSRRRLLERYVERWTARGRCPADDLLDEPDAPLEEVW